MSDLKLNEDVKLPEIEYNPSTIAISNAAIEASSFYNMHRFGDVAAWFNAAERLAYRALIREDQLLAALRESAADKQRITLLEGVYEDAKAHIEQWRQMHTQDKQRIAELEAERSELAAKVRRMVSDCVDLAGRAERAESQLAIARDLIESMKQPLCRCTAFSDQRGIQHSVSCPMYTSEARKEN